MGNENAPGFMDVLCQTALIPVKVSSLGPKADAASGIHPMLFASGASFEVGKPESRFRTMRRTFDIAVEARSRSLYWVGRRWVS
jgi:hypothetical protein